MLSRDLQYKVVFLETLAEEHSATGNVLCFDPCMNYHPLLDFAS